MTIYFNSDASETHAATKRAGAAMAEGFAAAMELMAAVERSGTTMPEGLPAHVSKMASSFALAAIVHSDLAARSAAGSVMLDAAAAEQFAKLRDLSRSLGGGIVDAALARLPEPDRSAIGEFRAGASVAWHTLLRLAAEGARIAAERAVALESSATQPQQWRSFAADLAALQMLGIIVARLLS